MVDGGHAIGKFFDSESTAIQLRSEPSGVYLRATTTNYDKAAARDYTAYFHKLDPWANGWWKIGRAGIFAGPELVDPEVLRRSEIYQDFCRRIGAFHFLGAGLSLRSGQRSCLAFITPSSKLTSARTIAGDLSSCCHI